MSNKEDEFSPAFLWHKAPLKRKAAAAAVFALTLSLMFGMGFMAAKKADRAPIVIEQCALGD